MTGTREQVITITPDTDELKKQGLDAGAISTAIQNAASRSPRAASPRRTRP